MSAIYDDFKAETIKADDIIRKASEMRAVSDEFRAGFNTAMWEAREAFARVEDKYRIEPIE